MIERRLLVDLSTGRNQYYLQPQHALSAKFVTIISRGTEKIFVLWRFYQFVVVHNIIL
jgi:hypothetical protein